MKGLKERRRQNNMDLNVEARSVSEIQTLGMLLHNMAVQALLPTANVKLALKQLMSSESPFI